MWYRIAHANFLSAQSSHIIFIRCLCVCVRVCFMSYWLSTARCKPIYKIIRKIYNKYILKMVIPPDCHSLHLLLPHFHRSHTLLLSKQFTFMEIHSNNNRTQQQQQGKKNTYLNAEEKPRCLATRSKTSTSEKKTKNEKRNHSKQLIIVAWNNLDGKINARSNTTDGIRAKWNFYANCSSVASFTFSSERTRIVVGRK